MDRQLPERLLARLTLPVPGPMVGTRFEPQPALGRHYDRPAPNARSAAVLILLYPKDDRWHLPLTLRPTHLPAHAGQISLPGGAIDPEEASRDAAIREFYEELGAAGHPIEILGALSPIYTGASNFRIEPWVGATSSRPPMTPNPAEVEELLEVPLEHLADATNFGCHPRAYHGQRYQAPHFYFPPHKIWGATCMILGEFVTILEDLNNRRED